MQIENINVEELSAPKGGQRGVDSKSVRDTHVRQVDRQDARKPLTVRWHVHHGIWQSS